MSDSFQVDIEKAFLGTLMIGGLIRVRSLVRPEHFFERAHAGLYETICVAHDRTGSTKSTTVVGLLSAELRELIEWRTGGTVGQYLAHLLSTTVYQPAQIELAARTLLEQWSRLAMVDSLGVALSAAQDPAGDPSAIARMATSDLDAITNSLRGFGRGRSRMMIGEAGDEALAVIEAALANKGLSGISWGGLSDIDRVTGGLQRQDLVLVGARPSVGKTSFAVSVGVGIARKNHGVAFWSVEMPRKGIVVRALSDLTERTSIKVPYSDMLNGRLTPQEHEHVRRKVEDMRALPLEIDDAALRIGEARGRIESTMERFERGGLPPLDVVFIDHLSLIRASDHYRGNKVQEVAEITGLLKEFAKEFGLTIVLLSQLSRQLTQRESKRPQLGDLRDSGAIEQDADVVGFLHRPSYFLEKEQFTGDKEIERQEQLDACRDLIEFDIAKQRQGPTVRIDLWCDMALSAVRSRDARHS